jgi:hypothetical protein
MAKNRLRQNIYGKFRCPAAIFILYLSSRCHPSYWNIRTEAMAEKRCAMGKRKRQPIKAYEAVDIPTELVDW